MVGRRTSIDNIEVSFHLSRELVKALKMKAIQEEIKFSKVAETGLRQYLGLPLPKEKELPSKKEKGSKKANSRNYDST